MPAEFAEFPVSVPAAVLAPAGSGDQVDLAGVLEIMTFRGGFTANVVIAGTSMLGLAAAMVGVFAMLRKRTLVADALSHAMLPGIAVAFLVAGWLGADGRSLPVLLLGAAATGVLGVLCIQIILRGSRLHEDAAIGIVLSVFFGAGVVGLSYIQQNAPDGSAGIKSFIFGQAAAMRVDDVRLLAGIAALAAAATFMLMKEFALVCFNDAFARVDGWPVGVLDLLMMAMVVLVTVAGIQAVGLILVVAMLIIPPVAARFWTERLWKLVVIAGGIGAFSGYLGAVVSSIFSRKPAGAVVVLTAGAVFLFSLLAAPSRGVVAVSLRRLGFRLRIAGDHLLELAHDLRTRELDAEAVARLAAVRAWPRLFRPLVLRSLRRGGMLEASGAGRVRLTEAGARRGARVARNHALWEQYLVSYADIAPSHVDWSVDQVEHVLSDGLIRELEDKLRARGAPLPSWDAATGEATERAPA